MVTAGTYPASAPVQAADNITTDSVLWYNVGIYGEIGYAVPNPSNDIGSLNPTMLTFTNSIGKGLFYMMHHEDIDLSTPPTFNTMLRVHQFIKYTRQLVASRTQPENEPAFEVEHVTPAGEIFRVWPIPYFRVRNETMRRWAGYTMYLLAELYQNSENRRTMVVFDKVGERIGGYLGRIYYEMATEFFNKTPEEARAPGFLLTPEDFANYNPSALRPDWEAIDPVPALDNVFTEDRKAALSAGIPLHELPKLEPYPSNLLALMEQMRAAREGKINPDTGQAGSDGSRIPEVPPFPTTTKFI
jgi:hypothetical protein